MVAVILFSGGASVSMYQGGMKNLHPHEIENAYINYIVLGRAFVFESGAWWVAFKEFKLFKGQLGFTAAICDRKGLLFLLYYLRLHLLRWV
jgi:hypothetical protein